MHQNQLPRTATGSIIAVVMLAFAVLLWGGISPASSAPEEQRSDEAQGEYAFGPDDVIRILVENHPEWSGEFTVKPDGTIFLPVLGEFKAKGLTRSSLERTLTERLSRYITSPLVTVDTVRYISQTIHVLGEVNRPGEYPTGGKALTVRDAVVLAGLPARFAATGRVYVITPSQGKPRQQIVNLYRILYRGELRRNIEVKPGDIVYVPQTIFGMISDFFGAILNPVTRTYREAATASVLR